MSENEKNEKNEKDKREEVIEKLLEEHDLDEMTKFSEIDIQDKLQNNAFLIQKYTELLYKEKDIYARIMALKEKILGERYDYYRFGYAKELRPTEIEKFYLPKDEKILSINKILRRQLWRVEFFEITVKSLTSMGWNMKSYLQSLREGL